MKAVQLTEIGSSLAEREVPTPTPNSNEVLVKVRAAGICRSDLHYRDGASPVGTLPLTLGHEVAGEVVDGIVPANDSGEMLGAGTRVCLHYLCTCGACAYCLSGREQFCPRAQMIGKHRDGGYAEFIAIPSRSAVPIPDSISFEHAAVMMCSTSTAVHALRKARLTAGETVAVVGTGGLGMSAVQLAGAMGALAVYALDIDSGRLETAAGYGAIPVRVPKDASPAIAAQLLLETTGGDGVDVAVELVGLPETIGTAIAALRPCGRAAIAGIGDEPTSLHIYREIIGAEREVIGVSDHTLGDIEYILALAEQGRLRFDEVVTGTIPLEAGRINARLDEMAHFAGGVRLVISP